MPPKPFEVTDDVAQLVRARVDGERFQSESDVIREGLAALKQRDEDLEKWLEEVVYPAQDAIMAHPEKGRTPEQIRARVAEELRLLKSRS
jgi:Arc/MetJ-type ribon-helix-helix transcriptional regulator